LFFLTLDSLRDVLAVVFFYLIMNFQLLIDLVVKVSVNFKISQRGNNVVVIRLENEDEVNRLIEEFSVYEEFSVIKNGNELLVSIL
jgi:hypothetical protein